MSAFTIKAEGGTHASDPIEIRRALHLLFLPGDRHSMVRLPGGKARAASIDDIEAALDTAQDWSDGQVYYSINTLRAGCDQASKASVLHRRWLLIDVDTIRPSRDVSSTDVEKAASSVVAVSIADYLCDMGWPSPLMVDSGNGWHLLYRVDLPNDPLSQQILKSVLYSLAERFDGPAALIDRGVHSARQLAKLPGTMARKGIATPDRPHRMARLVYEPDRLEIVTTEQLKAIGEPVEATNGTNGHAPPSFATRADSGPDKSSYVRSAIERECYRVALANPGQRNEALNKSAFALGQFAGWSEMDENVARATLQRAAERAGLTAHEILLTIASGWAAGMTQPRPRPIDPGVNSKAGATASGPLTIRGNQVKPETVDWIWPNIIALNFMNLFAGRTGIGKSFILCDVAARLSRGLPMPDGTGGGMITNTLFISEDPYQYVIVPRLMELGADLSRIGFMRWEAMASYHLSDTDLLHRAWEETDRPRNIVIDPPSNFLGGKDEHKNAETRSVLMKLVEWLEKRPVALSLITHFNKGGAGKALDAIYRIMASVAWGSTSRVACGCEVDPDDATRCIFGGIKNNLGPKAGVLGYRIEATQDLAKIVWLGPVDSSIDDAINKVKKKTRAQNAAEWLADRFRERRAWPSDELYALGRAEGVSRSALWEAAETLPLKRELIYPQDGGQKYWQWTAHPDWPPQKASPISTETDDTLETLSHKSKTHNDMESVSNSIEDRNDVEDRNATEGVSVSAFHSISSVSGGDPGSETQPNQNPLAGKPEGYPGAWKYFDGDEKGDELF